MRTVLIDDLEQLAGYEADWEALRERAGGTVFSSSMLVRTWLEANRETVSPRVLIVEEGNEIVGIAPLAAHRYRLAKIPLKVLALAGEVPGKLYLATNTVLFPPGRTDVLEAMVTGMKSLDWQMLTSVHMPDVEAVRSYQAMTSGTWHQEAAPPMKLLTITVPEEGDIVDTFDKNARKNVRKCLRLLDEGGHQVTLRRVPADDVGRAVERYARKHIERWEAKGGSYFQDPANERFLSTSVQRAMEQGCGFALELLIDGEVAAQNFGFLEGETARSYRTGMDMAFADHSPGWLIKKYGLEAMRDAGIKRFVLGIGGEEHKYRMGAVETELMGFRATRGYLSAMMRVASSPMVKQLDSRFGLLERTLHLGSA